MWLSNKEWCLKYLGVDHTLLDSRYVVLVITLLFGLAAISTFFIKEDKDSMDESATSNSKEVVTHNQFSHNITHNQD
jgi:hypothetical protein